MMPEDLLATLTYEKALNLLGRTYCVTLGLRSLDLQITRVIRAAEDRPRPKDLRRDSFSIFFRGPGDVMLVQRMYDLVADRDSLLGLFIVPVGKNAEGYEYEAVFN